MALSEQEILAGLAEIVNEETGLPADSVELGKSFTDDLDIDSLSMMTIVTQARTSSRSPSPTTRSRTSSRSGTPSATSPAPRPETSSGVARTRAAPASPAPPPRHRPGGAHMSDVPAVVVTGLGATSPIGGTAPDSWRAALAGTSGVATMTHDWVSQYELPVTFAAEAAVDPGEVLARPETRRMDRAAQLAVAATREAWADAGAPEVDGERIGVAVSTGLGGLWTLMDSWDTLKERGPRRVLPMTVPMLMPNSSAAYVSLDVGAKAGVHTTTSACASGAEAVAYGLEMIRSGRADIVVTGGTEASVHALPIAAFARMQALSTRNDSPRLPRVRMTPPGTGSCSGRAPVHSSWSARTMPVPAGPRSTPGSPGRDSARMRTTSPPPSRRVRARSAPCARRWPTPA